MTTRVTILNFTKPRPFTNALILYSAFVKLVWYKILYFQWTVLKINFDYSLLVWFVTNTLVHHLLKSPLLLHLPFPLSSLHFRSPPSRLHSIYSIQATFTALNLDIDHYSTQCQFIFKSSISERCGAIQRWSNRSKLWNWRYQVYKKMEVCLQIFNIDYRVNLQHVLTDLSTVCLHRTL